MPGQRLRGQALDQSLCRRCQSAQPEITVRTDPLCRACFAKYVTTKVVKRMESFRVRHTEPGKERKLLLPLAFEASSVTLLHILSHHLKGQIEKTGRTGFKLSVLHVANGTTAQPQLGALMQAYPDHEYQVISLSDALSLEGIPDLFDQVGRPTRNETPNEPPLLSVLQSLNSNTARADLEHLLSIKLIVQQAKLAGCEAVLWADSTTRLAERVLSETAKGRGHSLPWVVSDGDSPHGIPFYYPLSEVLSKEIISYTALVQPGLEAMILKSDAKPLVNSKNTTIDDLMCDYFQSVEQEYPSIVANVVRTSGKLVPTSLELVKLQCELCDMPLTGSAPERSRLCYGCIRTLPMPDD